MQWWLALILGGAGGSAIQVLAVFHAVNLWEQARKTKAGLVKANPPSFARYVDWKAHLITGLIRLVLGGGVAVLLELTGQISQPFAALALGFSAPAILYQLGNLGLAPGVRSDVQLAGELSTNGGQSPAVPSIQPAPARSPSAVGAPDSTRPEEVGDGN